MDPISYILSENSNYGQKSWRVKANHCWALSTNIWKKKFVDLLPQVNFPANNLNFLWRWRWWDRIQAIFLIFFYFNSLSFYSTWDIKLCLSNRRCKNDDMVSKGFCPHPCMTKNDREHIHYRFLLWSLNHKGRLHCLSGYPIL